MTTLKRCSPFMTVRNGRLECHLGADLDKDPAKFDLTPEGEVALAKFYAELEGFDPLDGVMCSSSVDFADEYGAPEGFDAHDFLGRALDRAYTTRTMAS